MFYTFKDKRVFLIESLNLVLDEYGNDVELPIQTGTLHEAIKGELYSTNPEYRPNFSVGYPGTIFAGKKRMHMVVDDKLRLTAGKNVTTKRGKVKNFWCCPLDTEFFRTPTALNLLSMVRSFTPFLYNYPAIKIEDTDTLDGFYRKVFRVSGIAHAANALVYMIIKQYAPMCNIDYCVDANCVVYIAGPDGRWFGLDGHRIICKDTQPSTERHLEIQYHIHQANQIFCTRFNICSANDGYPGDGTENVWTLQKVIAERKNLEMRNKMAMMVNEDIL